MDKLPELPEEIQEGDEEQEKFVEESPPPATANTPLQNEPSPVAKGDLEKQNEETAAAMLEQLLPPKPPPAVYHEWPERPASSSWLGSLYNTWTYSYLNPMLNHGKEAHQNGMGLEESDLFPIPEAMKSTAVMERYHAYRRLGGESKSISWILWKIAARTYYRAGVYQLISVLCQCGMPILGWRLLQILEENESSRAILIDGSPYVGGMFLVLFINGLCFHRQRHLAMTTGVLIRHIVINIIFEHVLHMTPQGRVGLSGGEVTTLIAVDSQKLFEVAQDGHLLWSLPFSIAMVTILLIVILGPATLVGIIVLVLFVPLASRVNVRVADIRQARADLTDERVELSNSALEGMKVVKLNNFERTYLERISEVRDEEADLLGLENFYQALELTLTVISPVLAKTSTFAVYVLVNEDNTLTAARTFTTLLLFSVLRFPINYAATFLGKFAQAAACIDRLEHFLQRERIDGNQISGRQGNLNDPFFDTSDSGFFDDGSSVGSGRGLGGSRRKKRVPKSGIKMVQASFAIRGPGQQPADADGATQETNKEPQDTESKQPQQDDVENTPFRVSGFNFEVKKGEVVAVCGPVGSGKSTLVNGIIGEAALANDHGGVLVNGDVAYAPQTPFLLHATVRENILFGAKFDRELYEKVVHACCLTADFKQLGAARDLTMIGDRGLNLSGGQRQRISLARAAYACPDVVVLDDPLSALDAATGRQIFKYLIKGERAFFRNTAVMLVTHASHFLNQCDSMLLIVGGRCQYSGHYSGLQTFESDDPDTMAAVEHLRSVKQDQADEPSARNSGRRRSLLTRGKRDSTKKSIRGSSRFALGRAMSYRKESFRVSMRRLPSRRASLVAAIRSASSEAALTVQEHREHGVSSVQTWWLWFKYAGGFFFVASQFLFLAIDRFVYVAVEFWIAEWTSGVEEPIEMLGITFAPQSEGRTAQYSYLAVLACLVALSIILIGLRCEWAVFGGTRAARKAFDLMLARTLHAPTAWFDTTPIGQILNRFTYDIEIIDSVLTETMSTLMIACSWFVAGLVVLCTAIPFMTIAFVPVLIAYAKILSHYRQVGTDLQRLDAISRSPIQAIVSEAWEGSSTIHVFGREEKFIERFHTSADVNSAALLNFVTAQRWLGVRIETLGSIIVLCAAALIVGLNDTLGLGAGVAGLLIIWASNFTVTLGFMVDAYGQAEAAITAIERVDEMLKIPQEKALETDKDKDPPSDWPVSGELEFQGVSMRYRPGLPLALKDMSFRIPAGQRCGVCGRTGAGKSTLTVALFRLAEIEDGRIMLDGVELGNLGLSDVRGRKQGMAVIPQDPYLTGPTLRACVDPFYEHSETEVLDALRLVRMATPYDSVARLETPVEEGGGSFSLGQRQLLNVARAMLAKPKVLVLDEATASVDGETDAFIQEILRTKFVGTTLLTIAHRLDTIMDYELILVMDKGRLAEFGSPAELLMNKDGIFTSLVGAAGSTVTKAPMPVGPKKSLHLHEEAVIEEEEEEEDEEEDEKESSDAAAETNQSSIFSRHMPIEE